MPILVVNAPDNPPIAKSLIVVCLIRKCKINKTVKTRINILTPNFNHVISIIKNTLIPMGNPSKLPVINRLRMPISTSFLIFKISAQEIMSDKIKFIWIASRASNIRSKKGVAIIEKPKPVLVCRIDASKIITINKMIPSKNNTYNI